MSRFPVVLCLLLGAGWALSAGQENPPSAPPDKTLPAGERAAARADPAQAPPPSAGDRPGETAQPTQPGPLPPVDAPWPVRLGKKGREFTVVLQELRVDNQEILAVGRNELEKLPEKAAAEARKAGYQPGEAVLFKVLLRTGEAALLDRDPARRIPLGRSLLDPALERVALDLAIHISGIHPLKRNAWGGLVLWRDRLIFTYNNIPALTLPYRQIQSVLLKQDKREDYVFQFYYSHLEQSIVDTMVVDYLNERGGKMGLVLQTHPFMGLVARQWLRMCGVNVVVEEIKAVTKPK